MNWGSRLQVRSRVLAWPVQGPRINMRLTHMKRQRDRDRDSDWQRWEKRRNKEKDRGWKGRAGLAVAWDLELRFFFLRQTAGARCEQYVFMCFEAHQDQKRHKYESSLKNSLHDQGSSSHTEKALVSQGHMLLSASSDAEKLFCKVSALFPPHKMSPKEDARGSCWSDHFSIPPLACHPWFTG